MTVVAGCRDRLRGRRAGGQDRVLIAVIDFNNETDEAAQTGSRR
jgi:hypothetical protein